MKKVTLTMSVLSLALLAGSASAQTNDTNLQANNIRFLGAVSDTTCNLVPWVDGSVVNVVNVGVAPVFNGTGSNSGATPVHFALKADGSTTCGGIITNAGGNTSYKAASIAFMGALDSQGLANQSGSATGAYVEIMATNSNKNSAPIVQGDVVREIAGDKLVNVDGSPAAEGATFTAQLFGGTKAGDYQSAIAYQVSYQ
ncbi:fimbrial protein [Salmonella enterica subsp. enterica]|nr:fimbrial protein [Salmonella enterica subsp. enterica]ECH9152517.1 fimbrial protein [Salmonella enterica subsp. enterica]EGI5886277.1 hypothetical protein [Salmonella enterica subsp. enterica serovar Magwa]